MNPSEFPEVKSYPEIVKFLRAHVDMLFEDIRSMLKHPLCESEGGCNFATANYICDIISGISVILYRPDDGLEKERFKELMQNYYSWAEEGFDPGQGNLLRLIFSKTHWFFASDFCLQIDFGAFCVTPYRALSHLLSKCRPSFQWF